MACSRLALQPQDLQVQNPDYLGIWGTLGVLLTRVLCVSFSTLEILCVFAVALALVMRVLGISAQQRQAESLTSLANNIPGSPVRLLNHECLGTIAACRCRSSSCAFHPGRES